MPGGESSLVARRIADLEANGKSKRATSSLVRPPAKTSLAANPAFYTPLGVKPPVTRSGATKPPVQASTASKPLIQKPSVLKPHVQVHSIVKPPVQASLATKPAVQTFKPPSPTVMSGTKLATHVSSGGIAEAGKTPSKISLVHKPVMKTSSAAKFIVKKSYNAQPLIKPSSFETPTAVKVSAQAPLAAGPPRETLFAAKPPFHFQRRHHEADDRPSTNDQVPDACNLATQHSTIDQEDVVPGRLATLEAALAVSERRSQDTGKVVMAMGRRCAERVCQLEDALIAAEERGNWLQGELKVISACGAQSVRELEDDLQQARGTKESSSGESHGTVPEERLDRMDETQQALLSLRDKFYRAIRDRRKLKSKCDDLTKKIVRRTARYNELEEELSNARRPCVQGANENNSGCAAMKEAMCVEKDLDTAPQNFGRAPESTVVKDSSWHWPPRPQGAAPPSSYWNPPRPTGNEGSRVGCCSCTVST